MITLRKRRTSLLDSVLPTRSQRRKLRRALKLREIGVSASAAGEVVYSATRIVVGVTLILATAVALASLIPEPTQRRITNNVRDAARKTAMRRASSLFA